jgi:hypothetical protein
VSAGVRAIRTVMMEVTINSYKKDKYYPRVVRAVARILARSDVVAPVDVLIEMGNLSAFCSCTERANPLTAKRIVPFLDFTPMATASL